MNPLRTVRPAWLVLAAVAAAPVLALDPAPDALDDALAREGLTRADLGWEPRGYWSRFPADIPHKLRHFDDLMAQPLATVTFARTAAAVARVHLAPDALAGAAEGSPGNLYQAVQQLGVDRRFGGFRAYSANLDTAAVDLADALLALHERAGRKTRFVTFGNESDYPDLRGQAASAAELVPEPARGPVARLILDLADAQEWIDLAFRNVDPADRLAAQRRMDLGAGLTDALEYSPELDDVTAAWDEASLWYGALRATAAVERARIALAAAGKAADFAVDWRSPWGWVRLRGGGNDEIRGGDTFLVVDLGGDDTWIGRVASPDPGRSLSVALDVRGNDRYAGDGDPTQGAGLGGVGILLDGEGDDEYTAVQCAQGYACHGLGLLADLSGRDRYAARYSSQGSAFFGVGLLVDGAGDDSYRIESDGQGFGGSGGVGTLADRLGNDRYEAVRDPAVTERPSYHSEGRISVSNAQGVGSGRRGDGGDGHSWAGGLGQLLDSEGDDEYLAGNWSQGTGYWFGTGLLHDGAGNDTYRGVVWSQGSGAHFCIGALIDEAGDDAHRIEEKGSASLAFGHDFTVALHVDGAGNDEYDVPEGDGLGYAINRSVAMLLDLSGGDSYRGKEGNRPGFARFDPRFADFDTTHTYFAEAGALGLFLDVGGQDAYAVDAAANDSAWLDPEDSGNRAVRNFSVGVDVAEGAVDLRPRPER